MDLFRHDVAQAIKRLQQSPRFTALASLTLALGIGANSAVFSVVNGILLRPLPYPHADRVAVLWATSRDLTSGSLSAADALDFGRTHSVIAELGVYRRETFALTQAGREATRVDGAQVSVGFFDVLGTAAAVGRTFGAGTDRPGERRLVVISHRFWQQRFGGNRAIVGTNVAINGEPHTVVGVMPPAFDWPPDAAAWALSRQAVPTPPLAVDGDPLANRDLHYLSAVARLEPGVTVTQAQAALDGVARELAREFPGSNAGRGVRVAPLREEIVGNVRPVLLVLLAAVGCVLLVACANVAGLLLVRGAGRRREVAIRAALGASRARLVRQFLAESTMLAFLGGAIGVLGGWWTLDLLRAFLPASLPRVDEIGLDGHVVAWALLSSIATGVLFGIVPAVQGSGMDCGTALKETSDASGSGSGAGRARRAIVIGEIAVTLVLLVAAGLLISSLARLRSVPSGFTSERVVLADLELPESRYSDATRQARFYAQVLDGLSGRSRVEAAAVAFPGPLKGRSATASFTLAGRRDPSRRDRPFAAVCVISRDYFRTLGIPLLQGRAFTDHDDEGGVPVAIVNSELARRYFPGQDPIGQRLTLEDESSATPGSWMSIVGVVGNSRSQGLDAPSPPTLYLSYRQLSLPFVTLMVRSADDAAAVGAMVRALIGLVDPAVPLGPVSTLEETLQQSIAEPRFRAFLLTAFAGLAIVLAAVGLYASISHSTARRVREIGIRMTLGATRRQVLLPVLAEGLTLALIGTAIGLAGAFASSRVLASFLFGVGATDPATFAAVTALFLATALLATYLPARRASRVDPMRTLRVE